VSAVTAVRRHQFDAPAAPSAGVAPERELWTPVDGHLIHSRHWGAGDVECEAVASDDAPPVVLIHGFGIGSRMVRPVACELARRGFAVHAPDLPGFGDSENPDDVLDPAGLADATASWMRAHALDEVVLVGVSFGCQIAAEVARRHPGSSRLVVLASPTVDDQRRRWRTQLVRWQRESATQSMALRLLQVRDYPKAGVRRLVRTWSMAMRHRVEDAVGEIEVPVLVCRATRDPLVSRRWTESLARRAPHGSSTVLPGTVHALSHEHPLELARVIAHAVATTSRKE
jgi:pimeloyl-ACP methyl ester carboxylesterase